jgi:dihydroorotate dehydrogenase
MYKLIRPIIFGLTTKDAEVAHETALFLLKIAENSNLTRAIMRMLWDPRNPDTLRRLGREHMGLYFKHPVGLAAGFDKNGIAPHALAAMGFSFIELGGVVAQPQVGNPRPRLFRLPLDKALINRMGFNSDGAAAVASRLEENGLPDDIPVGINIGKSRSVPAEDTEAVIRDYLDIIGKLYPYADYLGLNISSPNTPGLRNLQKKTPLECHPVLSKRHREARACQSNARTYQGGARSNPGRTRRCHRRCLRPGDRGAHNR